MDPPPFAAGDGRPSPTRRELQGPRPTPLKVNKDSFKIKKPPVAPQMLRPGPPEQPPEVEAATAQNRQTVVIYAVSPKVIHTTASDFRDLVQRLTGPSRAAESAAVVGGSGDVSPAARFASIEQASPSKREQGKLDAQEDIMDILEGTSAQISQFPGILTPGPASLPPISPIMDILEGTGAQISQFPGILTPGPATLPPISPPGLFSPASTDPFGLGTNTFLPSPSILFSSPIVSPSYSFDLFNTFFDF